MGGERLEATPGLVGIAFPISSFLLFDTSGRKYRAIGRICYDNTKAFCLEQL